MLICKTLNGCFPFLRMSLPTGPKVVQERAMLVRRVAQAGLLARKQSQLTTTTMMTTKTTTRRMKMTMMRTMTKRFMFKDVCNALFSLTFRVRVDGSKSIACCPCWSASVGNQTYIPLLIQGFRFCHLVL